MSRVAVPSLPFGMAMSGIDAAGRTARIVLTGPGGGTWDQALDLGGTAGRARGDRRGRRRRLLPAGGPSRRPGTTCMPSVEGDRELAHQILVGAGRVLRLRRRGTLRGMEQTTGVR